MGRDILQSPGALSAAAQNPLLPEDERSYRVISGSAGFADKPDTKPHVSEVGFCNRRLRGKSRGHCKCLGDASSPAPAMPQTQPTRLEAKGGIPYRRHAIVAAKQPAAAAGGTTGLEGQ